MIHVSKRWRFVAPGEDCGYYDEEIVQHTTTEHRAMRRTFSDKVCADPVALEELMEQVHLAAKCNPAALPRIYELEPVSGNRTSVLMEAIDGRALTDLINTGAYTKMRDWTTFASHLVSELIDMRKSGARFDRLHLNHVVVMDTGEPRLTQRSPIGRVPKSRLEKSPILQRLVLQTKTGVYTSHEPPLIAEEMDFVKNTLLRMAAGSARLAFDEFNSNVDQYQFGSGGKISEILLGIQNGSDMTLERLRTMIDESQEEDSHRHVRELSRTSSTQVAPPVQHVPHAPWTPPSPAAGSDMRESTHNLAPRASSPTVNKMRALATPDETANPWASAPAPEPKQESRPPAPARTPLPVAHRVSFPSSTDEAVNPYAAAAAAATPVKGANSPVAPGDKELHSNLQAIQPLTLSQAAAMPVHALRAQSNVNWVKWATIVGVLAVVGFGGYKVVAFQIERNRPNLKPTAVITLPPGTTVKTGEVLRISAKNSADPENHELSYTWRATSPENASIIYTDASSSKGSERKLYATTSPAITAQFFTSGENVLELLVSDGVNYSDPVSVTVTVLPDQK